MEHTTLHLLYSRFWHKFLYDLGLVPTPEPYKKRTSHGLILAEGGVKMSKSKGNVINPDTLVKSVGADSLRVYEMFMGPFDQPIAWNTDNIAGVRRFLERVWKLKDKVSQSKQAAGDEQVTKILHKTIKKVSDDIESMRFNTAISSLMIAVNGIEASPEISREQYEIMVQLLAPFAPHMTEELWAEMGNKKSVHVSAWPEYDPKLALDEEIKIIVQVNGKVRGSFMSEIGKGKDELENMAKNSPDVVKWLEQGTVRKVIVVPDRLVNFVVS
jgi:leucyl-tRNA synthetase